jgi:threonine synthase
MLTCSHCGKSEATKLAWCCSCGGDFELQSDRTFRIEMLGRRPSSLWRYREALGIDNDANIVSIGEGCTPLVDGEFAGFPVKLKLDFLCPTGSFKDRGSSVMISKLKEWNICKIVEDSSGNAGASVAAYASAAGISARIFVPASTSLGKVAQISMYGAELLRVQGTREEAERQALIAAQDTFYASHNWSPYFLSGMKTAAYEIAEQLNWQEPEWVVLPVGGGSLTVGLYLGFQDLVKHGLIKKLPRLAAVQSIECAPVYQAWINGDQVIPEVDKKETAAEGIAVPKPVRGKRILQAIRKSAGVVVAVTDDAIWKGVSTLAKKGIYVEPTAAAAIAALPQMRSRGHLSPGVQVVVVLTGSGLKATDKIVAHYF